MKKFIALAAVITVLSVFTVSMVTGALASTNSDNVPEPSASTTSEAATTPHSVSSSSDSLNILTENTNFQNHGFEVKALTETVKFDRTAAIKKANESVGKQISAKAESITAVLAKFTDTETPVLPESNIALKDYPVWIVTYHGVTLQKQGIPGGTVYADTNVVIDANSGEVLETFSYCIKGEKVSNVPLPLNASPEAEYKMPKNLPGKSGGPFLSSTEIEKVSVDVAKAHGELSPSIKDSIMTTHGLLIEEGVFSPSYSVADDREVYLVTLTGKFTFTRVRPGADPIKASYVNIEIDATTGDVLAVGTSTATKDKEVLQRLKISE
jgi:hypothetical protein